MAWKISNMGGNDSQQQSPSLPEGQPMSWKISNMGGNESQQQLPSFQSAQQPVQFQNQQEQQQSWSPENESIPGTITRNVVRGVERIGELPFTLVPDIISSVGQGINYLSSDIQKSLVGAKPLGEKGPALTETSVLDKALANYSPTSENFGKLRKKVVGEYLEPQGSLEELFDNVLLDTATFVIPGLGSRMPIKQALAVAGLSNLASWGAKELGAGPLVQTGLKLGTTALTMNPFFKGKLNDVKNEAYSLAEQYLPKTAVVETENLKNKFKDLGKQTGYQFSRIDSDENRLVKLLENAVNKANKTGNKKDISKARSLQNQYDRIKKAKAARRATSKTITKAAEFTNSKLEAIEDLLSKDDVSVKQLWDKKKEINQLLGESTTPREAKKYLAQASDLIDNELTKYGRRSNKEFLNAYKKGDRLHQAFAESSPIQKTLAENIPQKFKNNPLVGTLLGGSGVAGVAGLAHKFGSPTALIGTGVGTALPYLGMEAYDAFKFLSSNKIAATEYAKVLQAAAKENIPQLLNHARKLISYT